MKPSLDSGLVKEQNKMSFSRNGAVMINDITTGYF